MAACSRCPVCRNAQLCALYSRLADDGSSDLTVHEMIDLFAGANNDALLIPDCNGDLKPHHWLGDGFCDDGSAPSDLSCSDADYGPSDLGDCARNPSFLVCVASARSDPPIREQSTATSSGATTPTAAGRAASFALRRTSRTSATRAAKAKLAIAQALHRSRDCKAWAAVRSVIPSEIDKELCNENPCASSTAQPALPHAR